MKVLFVRQVLGLAQLHYYLKTENPQKHDEYLTELLEAGYLEDVSDVFVEKEDKDFIRNAAGFLENEKGIYVMPSSWDIRVKRMRTEEKGIAIIEKYNPYLSRVMEIEYKEIKDEDFERMTIAEWDDGSESVLFNE